MKTAKLALSAIIVSLMLAPPSFARSRTETKTPQAANPTSNNYRPCCAKAGNYSVNYLKPRQPKNADLATTDDRKYTTSISTLEKQAAAPARANQPSNPTQPIATQFRLGSTHLRYGQETKALEAFTKAWTGLPDLLKDTKSITAAAGLARTHLIELQKLTPKEPALVLAMMIELSPQHEAAFNAISQPKLKSLLVMPLAATWTQLMLFGQLDKAALEKGAGWVLMFPNLVTANQPLPPEMRGEYESQLTQVELKINERIRLLAERQRNQAIGMRAAMRNNANAEAQGNDPMLQQSMANLDIKRGPLMQFMRADIAFRFGQFQDGLRDSTAGWKELIEFYRTAGGGASTADTDMHLDTLNQIVTANPVQGSIMLDHLDPAYRTVAPMMPFVGAKVAETWTKLAARLPLHAAMLEKAVFWNEHVAKTGNDAKTPQTEGLAELKKKLEEAKQKEKEAVKNVSVEKEPAAKQNRSNKAARNETPQGNTQSRQTGSGRINIPRSIGPSGSGQ